MKSCYRSFQGYYKSGLKNGHGTTYWRSDRSLVRNRRILKWEETCYLNDQPHGLYKHYNVGGTSEGDLGIIGRYNKGKSVGLWRDYDRNGKLSKIYSSFERDSTRDHCIKFWPNRQTSYIGQNKSNKRNGHGSS